MLCQLAMDHKYTYYENTELVLRTLINYTLLQSSVYCLCLISLSVSILFLLSYSNVLSILGISWSIIRSSTSVMHMWMRAPSVFQYE